ncbi:disulfide bond formation protein DsbA [Exiguobacterium sp. SH31]|uniref:DsbA family oxidoreductase n=1 Tax=unclassified Exiguobacterium TaxID=2644629 RepID=UPI0008B52378|nr:MULTISPECIES: DsbA family oxidoreductase [unclassified Exiguobacterium]OGX78347.1 disulfide bond formation protein DsbA [Exiguobacterium sp. SH31]TCI72236.1 DsbA family oxidoreductase [Exiguobacterium sp. SH0S7]
MKIEVWSDYVCPFCYIGKRRLEEALEQFQHADKVEVEFKSFELDPNAPTNDSRSIYEVLAKKYSMPLEQAKTTTAQVAAQAQSVGLDYDFDNMVVTGTLDSHRLTHYAKTVGKEKELSEALLKAYFVEAKHIGDHDVLVEIATSVGLDADAVKNVLASDVYTEDVRAEERRASDLGITGVPFFVFDGKYGVSGAQPTEAFTQVLEKTWAESAPTLQVLSGGATCTDDNCDI